MAVEKGREGQLTGRGMTPMPSARALQALDLALARNNSVTAIMEVSWKDLLAASGVRVPIILADIAKTVAPGGREESAEDRSLRDNLKGASEIQRREIFVELFIDQLSRVNAAQVMNYLKATKLKVGVLINFRSAGRLEWKRYAM